MGVFEGRSTFNEDEKERDSALALSLSVAPGEPL